MSSSKRSIYLLGVFMFMAVSFICESTVLARDYTRSCSARYIVSPTSIRGGASWQFDFTGRGTVGAYAIINKARERARRNIDECIDTHWRRYTATGRPRECTGANQVYNYPVGCLACEIQRNICRLNPGHAAITVAINATYSGDRGCTLDNNSWMREIARNHTVTCPGAEFEPNTDRPGSDIRSIDLPEGARPNACRVACIREDRCRAWTYVRPGVQGPSAKCWLKDRVPRARHNTNCTSGVPAEM